MKTFTVMALSLLLALGACSFAKKGESPEQVPSAGTTDTGMAVQPSAPEGETEEAPAEPTAPTPPEAQPPVQQ